MRILLGYIEVAGTYRALEAGFKALGYSCFFAEIAPDAFRQPGSNLFIRLLQRTHKAKAFRPLNALLRLILLLWAALFYDVFIIASGNGLFRSNWDLKLLKRLGKKIIIHFHGTDSRPPYMNRKFYPKDIPDIEPSALENILQAAIRKKRHVVTLETIADAVINMPFHGQFHEKPFLMRTHIGRPCVLPTIPFNTKNTSTEEKPTLTLLHCPTDPIGKGSAVIQEAVQALEREGHSLRYVELIQQPHEKVIEAMIEADIVIDQMYCDMGFSGFATEAYSLGKAVVMGGYAVQAWETMVQEGILPSGAFCTPETLKQTLEELIHDPAYREHLGSSAKAFVEKQWSPKTVAENLLRVIKNDIPQDWLCEPKTMNYFYGWGLSEADLKKGLKVYLEAFGPESLQLEDKPKLKAEILKFSEIIENQETESVSSMWRNWS